MILLDNEDLPSVAQTENKPSMGIRLAREDGGLIPSRAIVLDPTNTLSKLDPFLEPDIGLNPTPISIGYLSTWVLPPEFHRMEVSTLIERNDPRTVSAGSYWLTIYGEKEVRFLTRERIVDLDIEVLLKYQIPSFVDETYSFELPSDLSGAIVTSVQAGGASFEYQGGSYTGAFQYTKVGDVVEIYQGNHRLAAQAPVFISVSMPLSLDPSLVVMGMPLEGTGVQVPVQIEALTYTFARPKDLSRPEVGSLSWDRDRRLALLFLGMEWECLLTFAEGVRTTYFEIASEITG